MKLPASLSRFSHVLGAVACGVLMTTAQAWGFDDRQGRMDWEGSLNLTEEQEKQIDDIEDRYRKSFRELRASEKESRGDVDERQALYLQMREEMRNVLTEEQQALAEEQISERKKDRHERELHRLAKALKLTDEQKATIATRLSKHEPSDWPVDKEQRDADREYFDECIADVLTEEQQAKWNKLREKNRDKWRNHKEERYEEGRGGRDEKSERRRKDKDNEEEGDQ